MRWHSIGLVVSILLIAGCNGEQRRFEEPAAEEAPSAPPAAEAPAERAEMPAGAVPKPLEEAEEVSQDVQEDIADEDWDDAAKKTEKLQALSDSLKSMRPEAGELSAYDSAVTALAQRVQSKSQLEAAMAANEVSRAAISMMKPYSPKVPVNVGLMEVDARDAHYFAQAGDWAAAEQAAKAVATNYAQVQTHVAEKDADLDRKIRTEIDALTKATQDKNLDAVKSASEKVMDEIDDIEDTY